MMEFLVIYFLSVVFSHTTSILVNYKTRVNLAKKGYKINYKLYDLDKMNQCYYPKEESNSPYIFPINIYKAIKLMGDYINNYNSLITALLVQKSIIKMTHEEQQELKRENYSMTSIFKMSIKKEVFIIKTENKDDIFKIYKKLVTMSIEGNVTDKELEKVCLNEIKQRIPKINVQYSEHEIKRLAKTIVESVQKNIKAHYKYYAYSNGKRSAVNEKHSFEEAKKILYPKLEELAKLLEKLEVLAMKTKKINTIDAPDSSTIPFKISQLITRINRDDVEYSELVKILYLLIIEWYPNFIYIKYKKVNLKQ